MIRRCWKGRGFTRFKNILQSPFNNNQHYSLPLKSKLNKLFRSFTLCKLQYPLQRYCILVLYPTTTVYSCPDHTKLSVQFQPWNRWWLCSEIDVGPPLFTLLQLEMLTDGAWTSRCDQPLMPWSHQNFHPVPVVKLLRIMLRNKCWPTTFHSITAGDADGWCQNWRVWSTHETRMVSFH